MTGAWVTAVAVLVGAWAASAAPRMVSAVAVGRRIRTLDTADGPRADGRVVVPPWFAEATTRAAVSVPPDRVALVWLGLAAVLAVAGGARGGAAAGAIGLALGLVGPLLSWPIVRDRARRRYEAALPSVLEAVAGSLRSGAAPLQALADATAAAPAPVAADLRAVVLSTGRGMVLADALEAWTERRRATGVELAVAAMALALRTGGAQSGALDGVAATLRQRQEVEAEARALGTQARVSAAVIAAAPPAFGLVAGVADARTADFLLRTPVGLGVLVTGLALDAAGAVWMAVLTRSRP